MDTPHSQHRTLFNIAPVNPTPGELTVNFDVDNLLPGNLFLHYARTPFRKGRSFGKALDAENPQKVTVTGLNAGLWWFDLRTDEPPHKTGETGLYLIQLS